MVRARAWSVLLVALAAASGCILSPSRNDPDERAVAALKVGFVLVDVANVSRATGRFWVRLMPVEAGHALERELEWTIDAGAGERRIAGQFHRSRDGLAPALALFEDLPPGRYRLSSFLVSGRFERSTGAEPLLMSLSGELPNVAPFELAAGEVATLGTLAVSIAAGGRYDYEIAATFGPDEARSLLAAREDLRGFRYVARAIAPAKPAPPPPAPGTASPASPVTPAVASRRIRFGEPLPREDVVANDIEPVDHAPADRDERPGTRRVLDDGGLAASPGGTATGIASVSAATGGRSAIVLGLRAMPGDTLAGAVEGAGLVRIELRRVGKRVERAVAEVGWELEPPPPAAASDQAPGSPPPEAARHFKLAAPGGTVTGTALVLTIPVAPGEHELVSVELTGSLRVRGGGSRTLAAAADVAPYLPVSIGAGQLADLGTLELEVLAPGRLVTRVDRDGLHDRVMIGARAAEHHAGIEGFEAAPLVPVARPLTSEARR